MVQRRRHVKTTTRADTGTTQAPNGHPAPPPRALLAGWERVQPQTAGTATVDQTEREGNHDATGRRKRDDGRRGGGGKPNGKKAQETSSTSLGPQVSFFFLSHFIFILLTIF